MVMKNFTLAQGHNIKTGKATFVTGVEDPFYDRLADAVGRKPSKVAEAIARDVDEKLADVLDTAAKGGDWRSRAAASKSADQENQR